MNNNGVNSKTSIDALKTVFSEKESYSHKYNNKNYTIEILEIGNDYVFGAISRESDLKYTSFYQIRNKQTHKATPYSSVSPDTQLEVYTFFYIDCNQNRMAVLQHKNIGKIHQILSGSIYALSKNMLIYSCEPERIKNMAAATRKLKHDKRLFISFAAGTSKYDIRNLAETLGELKYDSYSITFKLSSENSDSSIDKLFAAINADRKSFKETKLSGKNEYGMEETIDFIETQFTQGVSFDITDDMVQNAEIIKEKLQTALEQNS